MPFGLKNRTPGPFWNEALNTATYLINRTMIRAMTAIFGDMMHIEVEDYVDDLVIRSKARRDHCKVFRKGCRRLQWENESVKLCIWGNFRLGFAVKYRGIEVDPDKLNAIQEMPKPQNLKQIKSV